MKKSKILVLGFILMILTSILQGCMCVNMLKNGGKVTGTIHAEVALKEKNVVWVAEEIDAWFYVQDYCLEWEGQEYTYNARGEIRLNDVVYENLGIVSGHKGIAIGDVRLAKILYLEEGDITVTCFLGTIEYNANTIILKDIRGTTNPEGYEDITKITFNKLKKLDYKKTYSSEESNITFECFKDDTADVIIENKRKTGLLKQEKYDVIIEISEQEKYVFVRDGEKLVYNAEKSVLDEKVVIENNVVLVNGSAFKVN